MRIAGGIGEQRRDGGVIAGDGLGDGAVHVGRGDDGGLTVGRLRRCLPARREGQGRDGGDCDGLGQAIADTHECSS